MLLHTHRIVHLSTLIKEASFAVDGIGEETHTNQGTESKEMLSPNRTSMTYHFSQFSGIFWEEDAENV